MNSLKGKTRSLTQTIWEIIIFLGAVYIIGMPYFRLEYVPLAVVYVVYLNSFTFQSTLYQTIQCTSWCWATWAIDVCPKWSPGWCRGSRVHQTDLARQFASKCLCTNCTDSGFLHGRVGLTSAAHQPKNHTKRWSRCWDLVSQACMPINPGNGDDPEGKKGCCTHFLDGISKIPSIVFRILPNDQRLKTLKLL